MAGEQASVPNKMAGGGNRECLGLIRFDGFVLRCCFTTGRFLLGRCPAVNTFPTVETFHDNPKKASLPHPCDRFLTPQDIVLSSLFLAM